MRQRIVICLAALLLLPNPSNAQQAPNSPSQKKSAGHEKKTANPAVRPATKPVSPSAVIPQPELLLLMIRTTLIALDQANKTGNYTVLRELGGPGFQKFMSADLGELFSDLRSKRIDLSPTVVVTPQMFEAPTILSNGMLRLFGYFPTQPLQINFELLFEKTASNWKLSGLRVSAVPPNAPATTPSAAAGPSTNGR